MYLQCPATNLDTNTGKSKKKNGEANYLYFHPRGVNRVPTTMIAQRPLDGVWSVERNCRRSRDCCHCYISPLQF